MNTNFIGAIVIPPVHGDTGRYRSPIGIGGRMRVEVEEVIAIHGLAPYRRPFREVVVLDPGAPGIALGRAQVKVTVGRDVHIVARTVEGQRLSILTCSPGRIVDERTVVTETGYIGGRRATAFVETEGGDQGGRIGNRYRNTGSGCGVTEPSRARAERV